MPERDGVAVTLLSPTQCLIGQAGCRAGQNAGWACSLSYAKRCITTAGANSWGEGYNDGKTRELDCVVYFNWAERTKRG